MRRAGKTLVIALVVTACGGNATSTTTTAPPVTTTSTQPPTTTAAPTTTTAVGLPETPIVATLDSSYHTAGEFDPAVMGFAEGDVTAHWYVADGFYVVVFEGFDHDAAGPACPGASIVLTGREGFWDFVANAESPGADCSDFPTLTDDPGVRALVCAGQMAFRTAIPADSEGTLYGTIEKPEAGGIIGVTSTASTDLGAAPEIDLTTLEC